MIEPEPEPPDAEALLQRVRDLERDNRILRTRLAATHPGGDTAAMPRAGPVGAEAEQDRPGDAGVPDPETRAADSQVRELRRVRDSLRESEARLRQSEERLRRITDNMPALIAYVDAGQRYRFNNRAYESWVGRTPEELFGLHLRDAVGATAYQRVRPFVESALSGERTSHEWWAAFPGGLRYTRSEYVPDRQEDGSIAGFYVLASDLTQSRIAELALAQSEARLRLALDAGRMAVWESDVATDTVKSSPEFNRLLGFSAEARPTMDEIRARYAPGGRDHLTKVTSEALARGDRYAETELGVVWPDGSPHWLLLRAHLNVDEEGRPTGAVGVVLDISERKEAAERIRFQAHLLDAVDEAVIATDLHGNVTFWNRFAERLYGWSAAQAMGRSVVELTSRSDPARTEGTMRHLAQGGSWSGSFTASHRDGSTFAAHVTDAPIFDEAGRPIGIVGVSFDITDRIRWEEHQKVLVNELNHRVKNSLATAQSIASQSLRTALTPQDAREAIERRLVALSRAHDVLTRENWDGADLSEIVRQAIDPHQDGSGHRFDVQGHDVRLPPRIALALAMALQELSTNAVKYGALSNDTGCVRISWSLKGRADMPRLFVRWEEVGGPPVGAPARRGFGVRLIERSLAQELDGKAEIRFEPAGVVCLIETPLGQEG